MEGISQYSRVSAQGILVVSRWSWSYAWQSLESVCCYIVILVISTIQVAFKSEYLQLFQAQQVTASELLVAKEALAEAKLVRDVIIGK